jgi:acetyl esterase/lipase
LVNQGEFFSGAGYVVLAIDYRSFGESEGKPRGQLFPMMQVEDFRNGVSFLQRLPGVDPDRIGIWGTSTSGGTVIYAAAVDRRIKAVVTQVPVVNHYRWVRWLRSQREGGSCSIASKKIASAATIRASACAFLSAPLTPCERSLLTNMITKTREAMERTGKPPLAPGATALR